MENQSESEYYHPKYIKVKFLNGCVLIYKIVKHATKDKYIVIDILTRQHYYDNNKYLIFENYKYIKFRHLNKDFKFCPDDVIFIKMNNEQDPIKFFIKVFKN